MITDFDEYQTFDEQIVKYKNLNMQKNWRYEKKDN